RRVELAGLLAEVGLRRRVDARGAAPVAGGVPVGGEDVLLALLLGHLVRQHDLLDLADVRAVGLVQLQVQLDELLGDRRTTTDTGAGDQEVHRAQDAHDVEARVLVERGVLGRDGGVLQVLGHLVQVPDHGAAAAPGGDLRHGLAVGVVDDDRLFLVDDLLFGGHRPGEVAVEAHAYRQQDHQARRHVERAADAAPHGATALLALVHLVVEVGRALVGGESGLVRAVLVLRLVRVRVVVVGVVVAGRVVVVAAALPAPRRAGPTRTGRSTLRGRTSGT